MKEKNYQEKKEECINLEKEEGVCRNCEKEVTNNQDGLQLDLCDQWFHCACERVSTEHYKMLYREDSRA